MPQKAKNDLLEWTKDIDIVSFVSYLRKIPESFFDEINSDNYIATDNRPYNEYFFLSDLNFQNSKNDITKKLGADSAKKISYFV